MERMDEFLVANDLRSDTAALRQRAAEDGYLFFRGLIPADALREVRREILAFCAEAGWLKPDAAPNDGIARPGVVYVEPEPEFMKVYNRVMKSEAFHALAHQPPLLAVLDALFGEPTLVHPRNIARIIFPQNVQFTTPAHQDYVHIQGTPETWTAWIPLADCPQEMGSLAVLAGSHRGGIFPVHSAYGAGGLGIDTAPLPYRWVASDFALGDALLFHSHAVHKALPNLVPDKLRLSVDYRYQGVSQPVTEGSLLPHHGRLTWEEIYADWKSPRYQFYWKDFPLNLATWTPEYHQSAR